MKSKVIILVNTGTPDKPRRKYVRRFLSEFLNDYRVIDSSWIFRKILVNLIIVPFRTPGSTGLYRQLWTEKGSPLMIHLENLVLKLRNKLIGEYTVVGAMRYGNPSLKSILRRLKKEYVSELIILPLYPQYSSSTTGSANELIMREIKSWNIMPSVNFISQFYSHPSFIGALVSQIRKSDPGKFDHVLFSYHGLPLSHIQKSHPEVDFSACECEYHMPQHGQFCYKATCYETTRLLAENLNLNQENFSTSFQSRLTNKWLTPFTDKALTDLILKGKKKVLVVAPSFVADCLETIVEIGDHYRTLFIESGGEELVLAESLNDNDEWVDAIKMIAKV